MARRHRPRANLPAYVIFHDATCAASPNTTHANLDALASISGVGVGKLERYGEAVLEVLQTS